MATSVITSLEQLLDNSGVPLDGGSVTVYAAGTTTPLSLFSNDGLTTAAANPIVLDSAGRHDMRYFTTTSYKLLIKNSGGTTLYTRDNIDPGIQIGTGDLAVTDGGTGASTAGAARTNLSAASAADLADLAADVAALSGTLGSADGTHIATGTTAQRSATPADGDIRRNTTTALFEGFDGAFWESFVTITGGTDVTATTTQEGLIELATAAEVTTGTDAARAVTPATQHRHTSAAKAFGKFAGGTGTLAAGSYNVTSVVRDSAGDYTVTIATDFTDGEYIVLLTCLDSNDAANNIKVRTQAAGVFTVKTTDISGTDVDLDAIYFVCYGVLV